MSKLLDQAEVKVEWADLSRWVQRELPASARKRSPGWHLSGIIRYVLTEMGKLQPRDETDDMPLAMAIGMAVENWVIGLYEKDLIWQPGEWCKDGVYGTPDGKSYYEAKYGNFWRLEEFKATWKSMHTYGDVLAQPLWMWQLAGNCHGMGMEYARLHVLWVCGDYRPPSPRYFTYLIQFTPAELEQYWRNVILKYRDRAPKET